MSRNTEQEKKKFYAGHRERLRTRYLEHGFNSLLEHEKLELILSYVIPRRDTKPLAKTLLEEFHNLYGVLNQSPERLMEIPGIGRSTASFLPMIKIVAAEFLAGKLYESDILHNTTEAVRYAKMKMGASSIEEMLFIYLNSSGHVLKIDSQYGGRTKLTPDMNRMTKILLNEPVTGVIIVHNHPGGTCQPSEEDIKFTEQLQNFTSMLQITLLDHIIVTQQCHCSVIAAMGGRKQSSPTSGDTSGDVASPVSFVYVAE